LDEIGMQMVWTKYILTLKIHIFSMRFNSILMVAVLQLLTKTLYTETIAHQLITSLGGMNNLKML
jgi:hypothetical protein